MREKFIILSALLLSPLYAYAAVCPTDKPAQDCWAIPGCQHDLTGCTKCSSRSYCDGAHTHAISCSTATYGLFPDSDEGSDDITDCYTDGYAADGTTPGCENINEIIDSSCKIHSFANESYYSTNTTYANIANDYGFFAMCSGDDTWNTDYHIEIYGDKPICLSSQLSCNKFTDIIGCTDGTVTGIATYNSDWDVSACHCEKNFTNTSNRHCNGKEIFNSSPLSIQNFFEQISFGSNSSYYCTKCEPGYYVKNTSNSCYWPAPGTATMVVCKCEEKIPKGHYAIPSECQWEANSLNQKPCQPHQCPKPGQTTLNDGAMDQDLCQYAPNDISGQTPTKFCDAKGCFSLSNEWAFNP